HPPPQPHWTHLSQLHPLARRATGCGAPCPDRRGQGAPDPKRPPAARAPAIPACSTATPAPTLQPAEPQRCHIVAVRTATMSHCYGYLGGGSRSDGDHTPRRDHTPHKGSLCHRRDPAPSPPG